MREVILHKHGSQPNEMSHMNQISDEREKEQVISNVTNSVINYIL